MGNIFIVGGGIPREEVEMVVFDMRLIKGREGSMNRDDSRGSGNFRRREEGSRMTLVWRRVLRKRMFPDEKGGEVGNNLFGKEEMIGFQKRIKRIGNGEGRSRS